MRKKLGVYLSFLLAGIVAIFLVFLLHEKVPFWRSAPVVEPEQTPQMKVKAAREKVDSFAKDDFSDAARAARRDLEQARLQLPPLQLKPYQPPSKPTSNPSEK